MSENIHIGCTKNRCAQITVGYTTLTDTRVAHTTDLSQSSMHISFSILFLSSGGWEKKKIKLRLTTLPRIFIRVVCRFNSVAFATQR